MNRTRTFLGALVATVALGGCDIPTEPPIVQQRWIIPVEEISLSVAELLPAGMSVVGGNFDVSIDPFATTANLGTVCSGCAAANGQTVPVPAFDATFDVSENLPADVTSASIASGAISISIQNGFSFDPIAGGGSLTVTLTAGMGGAQLGEVVIDGATESLPAGQTVNRTLSIGSATVGGQLYAAVRVQSVGGQTTTIDTNQSLTVNASVTSLLVSGATIDVSSQSVDFDPVQLDFDLDADITDRIQQGTVVLDVTNPFGVGVSGSVTLGSIAAKTFTIAATGSSTVEISYTGDELRQILSDPNATFSASGTASGASVTVSPSQEITLDATVDVTIEIG